MTAHVGKERKRSQVTSTISRVLRDKALLLKLAGSLLLLGLSLALLGLLDDSVQRARVLVRGAVTAWRSVLGWLGLVVLLAAWTRWLWSAARRRRTALRGARQGRGLLDWLIERPALAGSIGVLVSALVGGVVVVPEWLGSLGDGRRELQPPDAAKAVIEERRTVLALYAAVGAALGLVYTHLRHDLNRQEHATELARLAEDRVRTGDERFARAVELLGHEQEAVRVGAMHALAGLGLNDGARTQTSIDVLCAYLRQPFEHYAWQQQHAISAGAAADEVTLDGDSRAKADRERQVRRTAMRLVADLLPTVDDADTTDDQYFRVDLSGAHLDQVDLSGRRFEGHLSDAQLHEGLSLVRAHPYNLSLRGAVVHKVANLIDARLHGSVDFERTKFHERAYLDDAHLLGTTNFSNAHLLKGASSCAAHFHRQAYLLQTQLHDLVDFSRAEFHEPVHFTGATFHGGMVTFSGTTFSAGADLSGAIFLEDAQIDEASFHGYVRPPTGWNAMQDPEGDCWRLSRIPYRTREHRA